MFLINILTELPIWRVNILSLCTKYDGYWSEVNSIYKYNRRSFLNHEERPRGIHVYAVLSGNVCWCSWSDIAMQFPYNYWSRKTFYKRAFNNGITISLFIIFLLTRHGDTWWCRARRLRTEIRNAYWIEMKFVKL